MLEGVNLGEQAARSVENELRRFSVSEEEFEAIDLPAGWFKNQPRESDPDGGFFARTPGAAADGDTEAPHVAAAGPLLSTLDFWLNLPAERQFIHLADEEAARAVEQGFSLAVQFRTGSAEVEPHYRTQLTALAEGLARMITEERVPDVLRDATIYALEMGSLSYTPFETALNTFMASLIVSGWLVFPVAFLGAMLLCLDRDHTLFGKSAVFQCQQAFLVELRQ